MGAINDKEVFNEIALRLLVDLYDAFPHEKEIYSEILVSDAIGPDADEEMRTHYLNLVLPTVTWLKQERFITYSAERINMDTRDAIGFNRVRLTRQGLIALDESLSPSQPLIEQAKDVLREGTVQGIASVTHAIFQAVVRAFT